MVSVLTAAYLTREIPERTGRSVVYFFCKNNELLKNPARIFRTILYQLIMKSEIVRSQAQQIWENNRSFSNRTATLKDLVTGLIPNLRPVRPQYWRELATVQKEVMVKPPKQGRWRCLKGFVSSNSSVFEAWVASTLADIWFATDPNEPEQSISAFSVVATLYQMNGRFARDKETSDPSFVPNAAFWAKPTRRNAAGKLLRREDVLLPVCANLGHAYRWYGSTYPVTSVDLREAQRMYQRALTSKDIGNSEGVLLSSLSETYLTLYKTELKSDDLNQAIDMAHKAADLCLKKGPAYAVPPTLTLCSALRFRSSLTDSTDSTDDLSESIDYTRKILSLNIDDSGLRSTLLLELINGYADRFCKTGSEADLKEMVVQCGGSLSALPISANETFITLRKTYFKRAQQSLADINLDDPDSFAPFLAAAKALASYYADGPSRLNFESDISIINLNTAAVVVVIVSVLATFYNHRGRYPVAREYCEATLTFVEAVIQLLMTLGVPGDSEAVVSLRESKAESLIDLGDMDYPENKTENAIRYYGQAAQELKHNSAEKVSLWHDLSSHTHWARRGSHFLEYFEKAEAGKEQL